LKGINQYSAPKSKLEEGRGGGTEKLSFKKKFLVSYAGCSLIFFLIFILLTPEDPLWESILVGFIFGIAGAVLGVLTPSNNKLVCVISGSLLSIIGFVVVALLYET
jgi:hypothetical protein